MLFYYIQFNIFEFDFFSFRYLSWAAFRTLTFPSNFNSSNNIIQQQIMIHSKSFTNIRQPRQFSRAYARCVYYNEEVSARKDNSTIFHSPFKNGKKNKQYTNPSFISSDLFYPEQVVQQNIKVNIIKNKNQKVHEQLYNDRMKNLDGQLKKIHQVNLQRNKQASRVEKSEHSAGKSRRKIPKEQLIRELSSLINYQEEKKEKSNLTKSKIYESKSVFLDNIKYEKQKKEQRKRRNQLKQWVQISNKIKGMKTNIQKQHKEKDMEHMNVNVIRNNEKIKEKQKQSRRNAGLLAQILKEQIKQQRANRQNL